MELILFAFRRNNIEREPYHLIAKPENDGVLERKKLFQIFVLQE